MTKTKDERKLFIASRQCHDDNRCQEKQWRQLSTSDATSAILCHVLDYTMYFQSQWSPSAFDTLMSLANSDFFSLSLFRWEFINFWLFSFRWKLQTMLSKRFSDLLSYPNHLKITIDLMLILFEMRYLCKAEKWKHLLVGYRMKGNTISKIKSLL